MATLPWDQTAMYLLATDTDALPGAPTEYITPRRVGNSPQDVTDFHPGQSNITEEHLHEIFYVLEPTQAWKLFANSARPAKKRSANGGILYEREPEPGKSRRALLDFKALPDRIGTNEKFFWRRIDGRIRWVDITMRMDQINRPTANALNMSGVRVWRPALSLLAWHMRGTVHGRDRHRNAIFAKLTTAQIAANTTRGLTPGLIDPAQGEAGGRIPWPTIPEGRGERRRSPIQADNSDENNSGGLNVTATTGTDLEVVSDEQEGEEMMTDMPETPRTDNSEDTLMPSVEVDTMPNILPRGSNYNIKESRVYLDLNDTRSNHWNDAHEGPSFTSININAIPRSYDAVSAGLLEATTGNDFPRSRHTSFTHIEADFGPQSALEAAIEAEAEHEAELEYIEIPDEHAQNLAYQLVVTQESDSSSVFEGGF
ncbi:hypothetical protein MMC19_006894 [Ptychographa xylographoides]|nr:hypothetical protein [Ptychographa xylographoides]